MLNNYFELGRLVDTLHKDGYSYREIERDLRNTESNEWILRHTTLFSAHKFYLAVKSYFNSDVEEFLKKNPDIIWRELSHQILSCHRLVGCPTVEQHKIYTSSTISRYSYKNLVSHWSYYTAKMRLRTEKFTWLVELLRKWPMLKVVLLTSFYVMKMYGKLYLLRNSYRMRLSKQCLVTGCRKLSQFNTKLCGGTAIT